MIIYRSCQGPAPPRRLVRERSNTAHSCQGRHESFQENLKVATENQPAMCSNRTAQIRHFTESPAREAYQSNGSSRPILNRTPTFEGPTQLRHEQSPIASQWIQRTASDTHAARQSSMQLVNTRAAIDPYADSEEASSYGRSSPERVYNGRSISPATSHDSVASRRPSSTVLSTTSLAKKAPPPPPPCRAKKPPPPPPPMKRTLVTGTDI